MTPNWVHRILLRWCYPYRRRYYQWAWEEGLKDKRYIDMVYKTFRSGYDD